MGSDRIKPKINDLGLLLGVSEKLSTSFDPKAFAAPDWNASQLLLSR